jgi:hypothetical protein
LASVYEIDFQLLAALCVLRQALRCPLFCGAARRQRP